MSIKYIVVKDDAELAEGSFDTREEAEAKAASIGEGAEVREVESLESPEAEPVKVAEEEAAKAESETSVVVESEEVEEDSAA